MGFGMKKDSLVVSALHLLMTLAMPVLFFFLVGCLEKPEPKLVDLGVEASADDVEFELTKATYAKQPSSMKVGEHVDYEINVRIENEDITKVSDISQSVIEKKDSTDDPSNYRYVLREKTNTYSEGKVDTVEKDFHIDVKKPTEVMASFHSPLDYFSQKSLVKISADEPIRYSYHDLKVAHIKYPAPDRVAMKPNCLGLVNCELNATQITFTRAEWYSETYRDITRFNLTYSTDAPYLGVAVNGCLNFLYKANGREYLVTQCQLLRDFQFE